MREVPIYINCRDRVTPLRALVTWLEGAGHERIVLLDNASTYEPLLDYYRETPHDLVCLGSNYGARAIWQAGLLPRTEWFVYTDPDIIPTEECPLDAVTYMREALDRHPQFTKIGLGLYLEDVPPTMNSLRWERGPVINGVEVEPGIRASAVDTTFALYRPHTPFGYPALRTTAPYVARHASWYVTEPDEEDRYYLDHAMPGSDGSSWAAGHQRSYT